MFQGLFQGFRQQLASLGVAIDDEKNPTAQNQPTPANSITTATQKPMSALLRNLRTRYQDAYAVARGLVTTGKIIKLAALVAGGVLLVIGIALMTRDEGMLSGLEGLLIILLAAMVAGGGFITGILTAALGQFMSATIDTAVNTSENISGEEKAEILGLC